MNKIKVAIENELSEIKHFFNYPICEFTYTKVGGPCDVLFFPKTTAELIQIKKFATANSVPLTVLGNASNLIVRDGGIRGFVVLLEELNQVIISEESITALAGAKLVEVSEVARDAGLTGLEFAAGIPGSIGGAVYMNAGAYGGEISNVFESCEIVDKNGEILILNQEEMQFGYRKSVIQNSGNICLKATFKLKSGDKQAISEEMMRLNTERQLKQPLEYPSCGSVFKRPEGYFTGKLIQDAGLQGKTIGGAQISQKHAGFIVNIGNATAKDYEDLIAFIIATIQEKFDVTLQPEVRIIGEG